MIDSVIGSVLVVGGHFPLCYFLILLFFPRLHKRPVHHYNNRIFSPFSNTYIVIPLTSRAEESPFPQNILFIPFHLLGMQQLPVRVSLVMLVNIYSKF
jgi:hypothetical protein